MKNSITCELQSRSNLHALQLIYTGFKALRDAKVVDLEQRIVQENLIDLSQTVHLQDAQRHHISVTLNNQYLLYYDLHDSYEVNHKALEKADLYFKRSFSETYVRSIEATEKVFPLGLIFPVYSKGIDLLFADRIKLDQKKDKIKSLLYSIGFDFLFSNHLFAPRVQHFGEYPNFEQEPKVLFMVRAWDPAAMSTREKQEEYHHINEMRSRCLQSLKREFGSAFFGGFYGDYAREHYPDLLLDQPKLSKQGQYMKQLRQFPICVATTGLHRSIGWKMAEYVAQSKAIVSETLNYQLPGNFANEKNYLEFQTPEQCAEVTVRLFQDAGLRSRMMMNNYRYYQAYSKPEALVLNSLAVALDRLAN
ncbi:hypothetical protein ACQ4M3_10295 [Leptolyngbya sp. AN03gr2]|uniref:hypothetical protein n=1 Tax=unclassified Leptolyngbya TaxID=2650499 RepID=UPI003D31102F